MDKKYTIGNVTAVLMIGTAALFDGIQFLLDLTVFLLPLSMFLTICSTIIFFLWFALAGVRFNQAAGRKLLIMIAMTVTELAPVINAIPAISAGVIGMVLQTRFEDAKRLAGGTVTPQTARATIRKMRMDELRRTREEAARMERLGHEEERLSAANDDAPEAANDNQESDSRITA